MSPKLAGEISFTFKGKHREMGQKKVPSLPNHPLAWSPCSSILILLVVSHILLFTATFDLDFNQSRPKGRGLEPHRRHCVVVLEQDTFIPA